MTSLSKLALAAAASVLMLSSSAIAQQKTFNIWHFEAADSSNGITFNKHHALLFVPHQPGQAVPFAFSE